jgi:hypothetical protein
MCLPVRLVVLIQYSSFVIRISSLDPDVRGLDDFGPVSGTD